MIDRTARDVFAEKLRHLVGGRITNDEFEDAVPFADSVGMSLDPAVSGVFDAFAWPLYSDMHEYKLRGRSSPSQETRRLATRAIVFLHSDLEYEWRDESTPDRRGFARRWAQRIFAVFMITLVIVTGGLFFAVELFEGNWWPMPILALLVIGVVYTRIENAQRDAAIESDRVPPHLDEEGRIVLGDLDVWPFFAREDLDRTLRCPRLLTG